MGLDIYNRGLQNAKDDFIGFDISSYVSDKYYESVVALFEAGQYDIMKATIDESMMKPAVTEGNTKEALKTFMEDLDIFIDRFEIVSLNDVNDKDKELAKKYEYILNEDDVSQSRLGSYSTIHYLRQFAYNIDCLYTNKGQSLDADNKISRDEVMSILSDIFKCGTTCYGKSFFDNLCMHSDCGGTYIPTRTRYDDENGSSILLLQELDTLWDIDAIKVIRDIMNDIKKKYNIAEDDTSFPYDNGMSLEDSNIAGTCNIIDWVFRKMLYHAVDSVLYGDFVEFC